MNKFLLVIIFLFSFNLTAQTDFSAEVIKDLNILSISISDDGRIPPFEGGMFWNVMKGNEQRKYIDENGFSMECDGVKIPGREIYGACIFNIPMKDFKKIGELQVYKLTGSLASRLNRHFTDSAYIAVQGGLVYLSSNNTRREFFFGINDKLIKR